MSLSVKQREFTRKVAELINYAYARGIECTFGDTYRDARVHGDFGCKKSYSASKSTHKLRLAVDLNLFVNGEYIQDGANEAYTILGEFWEQVHPDARWGGRFDDANHFSFEHWGCK